MNILKKIDTSITPNGKLYEVNGHFHTPYSFSAFSSIEESILLAVKENIKILGINDFYSTAGYDEFTTLCNKHRIFPLYNIEFIGLSKEQQKEGIRVNDPNNPGRTYFSGKGLNYPVKLDDQYQILINEVRKESMLQVEQMLEKVNTLLTNINAPFSIPKDELLKDFVKDLLRERHIAKALRVKIFNYFKDENAQKQFLTALYNGKEPQAPLNNISAIEEELRGNLLKSGGAAFVPEDEKAFLSVEKIKDFILNAGGIPCYPVLLDDKNGNYTDFEKNKEAMCDYLEKKGVYCIELIPGRNSIEALKPFVEFFYSKKFIVTFGTEHNAPQMIPHTITCRNNTNIDTDTKKMAYDGTCIIAAHQYLKANNKEGYVNSTGKVDINKFDDFIKLGQTVIESFLNN
jgi:hypothetical protein